MPNSCCCTLLHTRFDAVLLWATNALVLHGCLHLAQHDLFTVNAGLACLLRVFATTTLLLLV
jgi:hypothetical protein